jgi:hypothetical protein
MTNCTVITTNSNVKVEENGRKAVFKNKNKEAYSISEIDDCLIKSGIRADWLVSKVGSTSIIVELKGKDISHACEQIFTSAKNDSVKQLLEEKIGFLIICSKFPRFDTFVRRAKEKSMKEFKAGFHVVCNQGVFDIDRVAAIDGPF